MPSRFDVFVTPVSGGFEVSADGVVRCVAPTLDVAMNIARGFAKDRPMWLVREDGRYSRL